MSYNKRTHLRQNIDAIKLALRLDKEKRQATPQEREILFAYSGFGGIKAILNPADKPEDIGRWSKSEVELFPLVQELHEVLRENSQTPEDYKRYVSSLKSSILTAFYTPTPVIDALASALQESGITPTRFLEPSAGTGAFISSFKDIAPEANVTGFEKDLLTGKILSHLYPQDKVRIEGYEKMEGRYSQHFDVIASNIPFGDIAVFDPQLSYNEIPAVRQSTQAIHNYFFVKSAQSVREGGIIAFITSQGVLNSEQNKPIREYLMNTCDVVSAVRLPNNLFSDHAGTEVGSDLIILQRNNKNVELSKRQQDFIESRKLSSGISINNLFRDFSRVVQTHSKTDTDPYGKPAIVFTHDGGIEGISKDLRQMLKEDFSQHLDLQRYQSHVQETPKQQQSQTVSEEIKPTPENLNERTYPDDLNPFWQAVEDEWFPEDKEFWSRKSESIAQEQENPVQSVVEQSESVKPDNNYQPTQEDIESFAEYATESDRIFFNERQPQPEDYERKKEETTQGQSASSNNFRGTLFNMDDPAIKKEPTTETKPQSVTQEPLITLYDLFGFTQEERSQVKQPKRRKGSKAKKVQTKELPFMEWREELQSKVNREVEDFKKE